MHTILVNTARIFSLKAFTLGVTLLLLYTLPSQSAHAAGKIAVMQKEEIKLNSNKQDTKKEDSKDSEELITLRLIDNGANFTAAIVSLTNAAHIAGLDKIKIKGVVTKEPNANNNLTKYTISWVAAQLNDASTQIDKPFTSSLITEGDIAKDTNFNALGNIDSLTAALQRLQTKQNEDKENKHQDNKASAATSSPPASAPASSPVKNPDIAPITPNIAVTKDPFIFVTSEGCEIKVDPAQGVAIVQERVLTDGKQTSSCGDSLTKYPLTNVYNACPVLENIGKLVAYEQYTIGYNDPKTGGRVEVQGCVPDLDKSMAMVEKTETCADSINAGSVNSMSKLIYNYKGIEKVMRDCAPTKESYPIIKTIDSCSLRDDFSVGKSYQQKKEAYSKAGQLIIVPGSICQDDPMLFYAHEKIIDSCSIRHDFPAGKSYQQKRISYVKDGKTVIISTSPCQDDISTNFAHLSTRDTCAPTINNSTVIFSSRKYIVIAGNKNYISECIPETAAVSVIEEPCSSFKYTHDFAIGQSYLNKNYYYMNGTTRVDLATCIKSEQIFTHYKDISGCTNTYDDFAQTSQIYAKIFITSDNKATSSDKTYLTSCQIEGTPVAYSNNGYKWRVSKTGNATINVNQTPITAYVGWRGAPDSTSHPALTSYGWTPQIIWSGMYYWNCDPGNIYCVMQAADKSYPITANGEFCLRGKRPLPTPWLTTQGITIDSNNSDTEPAWDLDIATKNWMQNDTANRLNDPVINPPNPKYQTWNKPPGSYNCTIPSCNTSILDKYNSYTRLDGSNYIDYSTSFETRMVCGNGNKLIN